MTDNRTLPEELSVLAGEYALGLLDDAEHARARGLIAADPRFREAVERWRGQLAPMLDEIEPVSPPARAWAEIQAATRSAAQPGNVHALRRKVSVWRGIAGAMTALAASLALVVVLRAPAQRPAPAPAPSVTPAPAAPLMVARLSSDKQVALVASWDPEHRQLLLASAAGMPVQRARSHELWVIPAGGKPSSLGVMPDSKHAVIRLPKAVSDLMREGATIAVSVEPIGGSPSGAPTGPVVASGPLQTA